MYLGKNLRPLYLHILKPVAQTPKPMCKLTCMLVVWTMIWFDQEMRKMDYLVFCPSLFTTKYIRKVLLVGVCMAVAYCCLIV
jgi:hypothetical protein